MIKTLRCFSVFVILGAGSLAIQLLIAPSLFAQQITIQQRMETKSPLAAAGLSFLVPGLGEAYVSRFDVGKYFSGSEAILWGGYAGLSMYANDFRQDMESFAISNAAAGSTRSTDENYFAHVG